MNTVKRYGRIYTSSPKELGEQEEQWLELLKTEISLTSEYKNNLLINLTWIEDTPELLDWVNENYIENETKIWFSGSIDDGQWYMSSNLYKYLITKHIPVSMVGFVEEHWYSWLGPWFYKINEYIDKDSIYLNKNFKWKYLCYNRKPRKHRKQLVRYLVRYNILEYGWVTFEQGIFNEVDTKTGHTEESELFFKRLSNNHKDINWCSVDLRFTRPEDHVSLGELNIWQNSFLNVITETEYESGWHISEKTWKPIVGLRPYLLVCSPNVIKILEKLGFYTPAMLFNNSSLNDCRISSAVQFINNICKIPNDELYDMWTGMLPLLEQNRNRLKELSEIDSSKILNWSQAKLGPWPTFN